MVMHTEVFTDTLGNLRLHGKTHWTSVANHFPKTWKIGF